MTLNKLSLYFHTIKYLKPIQIWYRLQYKICGPKRLRGATNLAVETRVPLGRWVSPARRNPSLLGPRTFCFLNHTASPDWHEQNLPKLWQYNLHYFDDLNAFNHSERQSWHQDLIESWIQRNPRGQGVGWEPYPLSLRIINWIKWDLSGGGLSSRAQQSLLEQACFLEKNLEFHILGNHLFSNAKALCFAGAYFRGPQAERLREKGLKILNEQIKEQFLSDGGHFERSTMYHSLALEDVLDLINLSNVYPKLFREESWREVAEKALTWMEAMIHPDREIAFFNDGAIGISPSPDQLKTYAEELGLKSTYEAGTFWAKDSGYVSVRKDDHFLMVDFAPVGPDYLPGHAHADTLSFEFSLFGQRVIVNSGTSLYEIGERRTWERSTRAHNTLEIDGRDSSRVWGGFRVAERAYPKNIEISDTSLSGSHDGYQPTLHTRFFSRQEKQLKVQDHIRGPFQQAISRLYFDPSVVVTADQKGQSGKLRLGERWLYWSIEGGSAEIQASSYAREFGKLLDNQCLVFEHKSAVFTFTLCWD